MKLLMEQWKKFISENNEWNKESFTHDIMAGKIAALLANQIVEEAGEETSWIADDLDGVDGEDLLYVINMGVQPENSKTLTALKTPRDYFKNNYADIEEIFHDQKDRASALGIEDEWIRKFDTTLEELSSWIETL